MYRPANQPHQASSARNYGVLRTTTTHPNHIPQLEAPFIFSTMSSYSQFAPLAIIQRVVGGTRRIK
ncbi:hypothetical protein BO78DRAFT_392994 [Aspergillus sclerotiicarbonarius CBS 121057]|uniref:Uncharacterized protein n=1 Tax=Aspergillus sclerotiicarbonarius (strain CBS 121057 / IBT 28362) TaxID=1448318 RepID=A0A319EV03_ASPSB|nr:hypothetical protein BO78DRAFT_392994 [Aspergillus sclerotiicarbonarius CBS 121057]